MINFNLKNNNKIINPKTNGGDGMYYECIVLIFLILGLLSEFTDAMLLVDVLCTTLSGLSSTIIWIISFITGSICFFSMISVGYQSNQNNKCTISKIFGIAIWLITGICLVWLRIYGAVFNSADAQSFWSNKNVIMGALTFILYIGTGIMTLSWSKQLFNYKLYEFFLNRRKYKKLTSEIMDLRNEIIDGINILLNYQNYADSLMKSKNSAKESIESKCKESKSLIEAKMSIITEPDLMDSMYNDAIKKNYKEKKESII